MEVPITVVDQNELFREGLTRLLSEGGFQIVASVDRLDRLSASTPPDDRPHLLLLDVGVLDESSQLIMAGLERLPGARVVALSPSFALHDMIACMRAGASGYLQKSVGCASLCASLELVAAGGRVFPSQLLEHIAPPQRGSGEPITYGGGRTLSARETEILRCLVAGDSNKHIAHRLGITDTTVKVHIKTILRKLRVANRTQAALWALDAGLAAPCDERAGQATS